MKGRDKKKFFVYPGSNYGRLELLLFWRLNTNFTRLIEQIKRSVSRCSLAVNLRFVAKLNIIFPLDLKESVLIYHHSFLIYQSKCECDIRYVGRTTLRLEIRIKQHVHFIIRSDSHILSSISTNLNANSAFTQHPLEPTDSAKSDKNSDFIVLVRAHINIQLCVLEALYITETWSLQTKGILIRCSTWKWLLSTIIGSRVNQEFFSFVFFIIGWMYILVLYRNTKVKVRSPDENTDYFDIVVGVLGYISPIPVYHLFRLRALNVCW